LLTTILEFVTEHKVGVVKSKDDWGAYTNVDFTSKHQFNLESMKTEDDEGNV